MTSSNDMTAEEKKAKEEQAKTEAESKNKKVEEKTPAM